MKTNRSKPVDDGSINGNQRMDINRPEPVDDNR